jgi:hypothetical protein
MGAGTVGRGSRFPATRIRKQPDNLPDATVHIKPPVIPNPHTFKHATLFIDSAHCCAV